jgi:hypothetical protein
MIGTSLSGARPIILSAKHRDPTWTAPNLQHGAAQALSGFLDSGLIAVAGDGLGWPGNLARVIQLKDSVFGHSAHVA